MTTAKFVQTNFATQNPTTYKGSIDANFAVLARVGQRYAPRAADVPAMSVVVDPGYIFDGVTLTANSLQTVTVTAAPGSPNSRIDRIVVDRLTGVASIITGTPGVSPTAPAITSGKVPVAQVAVGTSVTTIINANITDERDLSALGRGLAGDLNIGALLKQDAGGTGLTVADYGGQAWIIAGGTADAITATFSPAIPTLTDGHLVCFRATAANATTTPTFAPNGGTARTIVKAGNVALLPGDIPGNFAEVILRYNLANTRWVLLNPASQTIPSSVAGGTANAITATYAPANPILYDGLLLSFRASGVNTITNPTFSPDGLTARTITKNGGAALVTGNIPGNLAECIVRYNLANTRWELLNPASGGFVVTKQTFTSSGTYTPSTGMIYCIVEVLGAGAGGGGGGGSGSTPGGGGGGSYARAVLSAITVGASQTITIGAAGAGGTGAGTGGNGGTTTFGAIISCPGGSGGLGTSSISIQIIAGGAGGTIPSGGDINIPGQNGGYGINITGNASTTNTSGAGANSIYGVGGASKYGAASNGNAGVGFGSGGSGAGNNGNNGGAGTAGLIIITEFCSA